MWGRTRDGVGTDPGRSGDGPGTEGGRTRDARRSGRISERALTETDERWIGLACYVGSAMRCLVCLPIVALTALSCGSPAAPEVPPGAVRVVGTVHYYSLEGGFWAVRGDDGVTYDPMNGLPQAVQRENLRVTMVVKIRNDLGGVHTVGPIVEIVQIEPL